MHILINASNLKMGGAIQVTDSLLHELANHPEHHFTAAVSTPLLAPAKAAAAQCSHIDVMHYDMPWSITAALRGRDKTLDSLVEEKGIDAVLTIFGPSRWRPRVPHLCGFARSQICIPESPYWKRLTLAQRIRWYISRHILKVLFNLSAKNLWTENAFITERIQAIYPKKRVYTVTNYYNQVFDHPEAWDNSISLPPFDGITLLTVSANYPHKNLGIIRPTIAWLREHRPDLRFRFVLTLNEEQLFPLTPVERAHVVLVGPVKIAQVPHLFEQADIMFLPTLLECFSASYAEAMRMKTPILTSDLGFAHSLCADAACYFDATDAADLGRHITACIEQREELVKAGERQLKTFDTAAQRADKLIALTEEVCKG